MFTNCYFYFLCHF